MACCICGKNVAGLPVMRDNGTGMECCEICANKIGGPSGFIKYVDSIKAKSVNTENKLHISTSNQIPVSSYPDLDAQIPILGLIFGIICLFFSFANAIAFAVKTDEKNGMLVISIITLIIALITNIKILKKPYQNKRLAVIGLRFSLLSILIVILSILIF